MLKKTTSIPLNDFGDEFVSGISIEKIVSVNLPSLPEFEQSERSRCHSFFLIEKRTVTIEIDFQNYKVYSSSLLYMHPDQVHHIIALESLAANMLIISNENLNHEYITLLGGITPQHLYC